jgi:hypothetical protein
MRSVGRLACPTCRNALIAATGPTYSTGYCSDVIARTGRKTGAPPLAPLAMGATVAGTKGASA